MIVDKLDHLEQGHSLLHPFEGKPRITALLDSWLESLQLVEEDAYFLLSNSGIYEAEGDQLDIIGERWGVERLDKSNAQYRIAILSRISTQDNDGSTESVLAALRTITDTTSATFFEHYPSDIHAYLQNGYDYYTYSYLKTLPCAGASIRAVVDLEADSLKGADLLLDGNNLIVTDGGVTKNLIVTPDGITTYNLQTNAISSESIFDEKSILSEIGDDLNNPLGELLFTDVTKTTGKVVDNLSNQIITNDGLELVWANYSF